MEKNNDSRTTLIAAAILAVMAVHGPCSAATEDARPAIEDTSTQDDAPAPHSGARDNVSIDPDSDTATPPRENTLTGDWGGTRQRLLDAGLQIDLLYTADFLHNTTGGLQRGGAYMGNLYLAFQIDGEKLIGWQGGSAYLQVISNSGGRFNRNYVGSLMGVDSLEAPVNRTGIFQAWLQQGFLDDKASLRIGLYPIDSEFYVTNSSGVFLHPSFGMAAELANFGTLAGPSIYPTSTYGARFRIDPDPACYALFAITRGIASDRIDTAGPNASWKNGSGSMLIGEVGFSPVKAGLLFDRPATEAKDEFEPISKLALGLWRFTPQFPQILALDATGQARLATHRGAYLLAEQTVYRVPESNRDLALFVRYGLTDGKTSTLAYSVSAGLSVRGPFENREKDSFGIAVTRAHADPQGRTQLAIDAGSSLSSTDETVLEMSYKGQAIPGVLLQPVLQRIFNPGLYLPNATVAGLRVQLAF